MSVEGNLPPAPAPARRSQRGGIAVAAFIAAFVIATAAFAGGWFLGARRVVLMSQSPSRDAVAFVQEARCAAGRCQSIWLGPTAKTAKIVATLAGPSESGVSEQADEIAWTQDGGRVGVIINGYQLRLYDARTGAAYGALAIIDPDGFPSSRIARGVTFSANGAAITFDDCPRYHSGCKPGMIAIKP
jgi:hypothetical protein